MSRPDCHHNEKGQVDYKPLKDYTGKDERVPLSKQKYDMDYDERRANKSEELTRKHAAAPDWDEYERIQKQFN